MGGPRACPDSKMQRAERAEEAVLEVVCTLLTDPERLRCRLEELVERERKAAVGDPERQAELRVPRLERTERKRGNFQDMARGRPYYLEELRAKLKALRRSTRRRGGSSTLCCAAGRRWRPSRGPLRTCPSHMLRPYRSGYAS
jgi:hypothetical protein